jgi:hypothetical protein
MGDGKSVSCKHLFFYMQFYAKTLYFHLWLMLHVFIFCDACSILHVFLSISPCSSVPTTCSLQCLWSVCHCTVCSMFKVLVAIFKRMRLLLYMYITCVLYSRFHITCFLVHVFGANNVLCSSINCLYSAIYVCTLLQVPDDLFPAVCALYMFLFQVPDDLFPAVCALYMFPVLGSRWPVPRGMCFIYVSCSRFQMTCSPRYVRLPNGYWIWGSLLATGPCSPRYNMNTVDSVNSS